MLKLYLLPLMLLAFVLSPVVVHSQASEQATTLKACADLFGPSIDNRENLFEVNALFVLQAKYDPRGSLVELAVFPKYWLEEAHPEWTEPLKASLLTHSEYVSLLGRLDTVKPKGNFNSAGKGGVITNMTEYFLDQYGHAFVERGDRRDGIRFFKVYYSHEVEGKVEKKRKFTNLLHEDYYQVLVGELNYYVRREDYPALRLGRVERFSAVGPIKGQCFGRQCNP